MSAVRPRARGAWQGLTRRSLLFSYPPIRPLQIIQLDDDRNDFVSRGVFDHPYPATKLLWAPEALARERDLLATTGDYLRLWHVQPVGDGSGDVDVKHEALLNNVRGARCAWCGGWGLRA